MVDEDFIRNRLTFLRNNKNISERRMSTDLGRSPSYIQSITSGKSLPSMAEFLYICQYLSISPKDFFDDELNLPIDMCKYIDDIKSLNQEQLKNIFGIISDLKQLNSIQNKT